MRLINGAETERVSLTGTTDRPLLRVPTQPRHNEELDFAHKKTA